MIDKDVLRIMAELGDFTNVELQHALEYASSSVAVLLEQYHRRGYVQRISVGKFTLNTLTEKGRRIAAKLPAVDEEERLLPLTFEGIVPDKDRDTLPEIGYCRLCGHIIAKPEQFCSSCLRMWEI